MTNMKKLRLTPLFFLSVLLIAASALTVRVNMQDAPAAAEPLAIQSAPGGDGVVDETSNLWFVELEGAPAVEGFPAPGSLVTST